MAPYEVCIKNRKQQIILLQAEELETIGDLKKKIQEKTGVPVADQQPLYFDGGELNDESAMLLELNIVADDCPGGPIVTMGSSAWAPFTVCLKLPGGKTVKELVSIDTTVGQLKGKITTDFGIPYLMIKLYMEGTELKDLKTLGDMDVPPGCKLELETVKPLYDGPAAIPITA